MDKINFTGGFLITQVPKTTTLSKLYDEAIPHKRCIIFNLFKKNNFFFSTKDCYDESIVDYLTKNEYIFSYFPNINLKSRLEPYQLKETEERLSKEIVLTDISKIEEHIQSKMKGSKPIKYHLKKNDPIESVIKALDLKNVNTLDIKTKNNFITIKDKDGNLVAKISPFDNKGICYVMKYPILSDEEMRYIAINYEGKEISNTAEVDNLQNFMTNFKNAMKFDKEKNHTEK